MDLMELRFVSASEMESRKAYKKSLPSVTLRDEHVGACEVLTTRESLLERMPKNGVVAEVGVDQGAFSEAILRICDPSTLVLIDLWGDVRFGAGYDAVRAKFAHDARVHIMRGASVASMAQIARQFAGTFDWIYIDTTHAYADTAAELPAAARLVKRDGFICGDDHCPGNVVTPVPYGVIEAVQEFCVRERWAYRYLTMDRGGHGSFALQKIAAN